MGLPRALKEHAEGNLDNALVHYKRALDQGVEAPVLFQNLGALYRLAEKDETALSVYQQGLSYHPEHLGIHTNRANIAFSNKPSLAIQSLLISLRLRISRGDVSEVCIEQFKSLIVLYRELGLVSLALATSKLGLQILGLEASILCQLLVIIDQLDQANHTETYFDYNKLRQHLELALDKCKPLEKAEISLALAAHYLSHGEVARSIERFEQGLVLLYSTSPEDAADIARRQKMLDTNGWNFGCALLKSQQFTRGWSLYEHGLRVPVDGNSTQRWQRELVKPFSIDEVSVWRGESLVDKHILLLNEQAVGDAMMFLTLVQTIIDESSMVSLMLPQRLIDIYTRSLPSHVNIFTIDDIKNGKFCFSDFDYQIPLGSICQYRFTKVSDYSPITPVLYADKNNSSNLRSKYLKYGNKPVTRLIGVSWRGGGRPGRMRQKSVPPDLFESIMSNHQDVRFVSLQYGNVLKQVEHWRSRGIDIIHDPDVNALKNMNLWLDQVASCDAIISVANTTIHGSGGLGLPTMCLLSVHSDWRWFDDHDIRLSYWYRSVGILREDKTNGWPEACKNAQAWILDGSPMPTGPTSSLL